jgi:hypothetical protein
MFDLKVIGKNVGYLTAKQLGGWTQTPRIGNVYFRQIKMLNFLNKDIKMISLYIKKSQCLLISEWTGCVFGLLGAFLLATNTAISPYGWGCFLVANFALIFFAKVTQSWGLLLQQIGFLATSFLGIYRATLF